MSLTKVISIGLCRTEDPHFGTLIRADTGSAPVFVNKVLVENGHTHSPPLLSVAAFLLQPGVGS